MRAFEWFKNLEPNVNVQKAVLGTAAVHRDIAADAQLKLSCELKGLAARRGHDRRQVSLRRAAADSGKQLLLDVPTFNRVKYLWGSHFCGGCGMFN